MLDPFAYDDYRAFLRDSVEARRAGDAKFSLAYFSRRIGASESYLKHVASGVRPLNLNRAGALAAALELTAVERSYFMTLVMRSQAKTPPLCDYYDDLLAGLRSSRLSYTAESGPARIFQDTLAWEIFTLAGLAGFSPDPVWIARKLRRPKLSAERVARCLATLEATGALRRVDGRFVAQNVVLPHGESVLETYVLALERAVRYLRGGHEDEAAHFDAFCLVSSDDELARVKRVIEDAKGRIAAIVGERKGPKTRIAFLNMNLFPVSE